MANNGQKEAWIDEVMGSVQGMNRTQVPADLYSRVISGVHTRPAAKKIALPITRWAAAAILLLSINVGSVLYATIQNKKATTANPENVLAAELQTGSTYNY